MCGGGDHIAPTLHLAPGLSWVLLGELILSKLAFLSCPPPPHSASSVLGTGLLSQMLMGFPRSPGEPSSPQSSQQIVMSSPREHLLALSAKGPILEGTQEL